MKLKTIQNKNVLKTLKQGKTYFADYSKINFSEYKKQWKKLAELCEFKHCPIFCVPKNNDYAISASNIYEDDDNILIELNVPDKECKIMDYYDWSDYLLYSSGGDYDSYFNWGETKALNNIDKYIILGEYVGIPQVVIDRIEPEWVVGNKLNEKLILEDRNPLTIKNGVLVKCRNVSGSITIPDSVTEIGNYAFSNCSKLTSITIPDSVKSIGDHAFSSCYKLASITIPNSVTSIGDSAFYSCYKLASITIPNSVISIGGSAFSGCAGLTSITIPDSVTSIGGSAFSQCSSLTSITIPNSVTSIGYEAFSFCSRLTSITIPNSVTSIGDWAFYRCTSLTSVTIPNSVKKVGDYAFSSCYKLASITIPNSVTSIGINAFLGCPELEVRTTNEYVRKYCIKNNIHLYTNYVELESLNKPLLEDRNPLTIEDGVLVKCRKISGSITIPNSVTSIGGLAFYNCYALTSITIPNSVTSIGNYAFEFCDNLTSINIPNSVTSIGINAFYGCSSLTLINVDANNPKYVSIDGVLFEKNNNIPTKLVQYPAGKEDTSYNIPNSVTSIGDAAFYDCSSLISITIPNSVTSIEDYAFRYCSRLASITVPDSVKSIGDFAFSRCSNLSSLTMPISTSIDQYSFEWVTNLTSVTLTKGTGVGSLGSSSRTPWYKSKDKLEKLTLEKGITFIGRYAFEDYTNLISITIPDSVTEICDYAFHSCSKLTSINIPNSVTYIDDGAFYNCSSLTSVIIPNSVTSIGDYAFYDCYNLTSIEIPDSVTEIGKYAFLSCPELEVRTTNEYVREYCIENDIPLTYNYVELESLSKNKLLLKEEDEEEKIILKYNNIENYCYDLIKYTEDELINLCNLVVTDRIIPDSPMFVTNSGKIIDVKTTCEKNDWFTKNIDYTHADLLDYIFYKIMKANYEYRFELTNDNVDVIKDYGEDWLFDYFTDDLGWIRLNCGTTTVEYRFYMVLSRDVKINNKQSYKIEDFLEWGFNNNRREVLVFAGNQGDVYKVYSLINYTPDDIITRLRQFYNTGYLLERKINNTKNI